MSAKHSCYAKKPEIEALIHRPPELRKIIITKTQTLWLIWTIPLCTILEKDSGLCFKLNHICDLCEYSKKKIIQRYDSRCPKYILLYR